MEQHEDKRALRKADFVMGVLLLITSIFFFVQSWKLMQRSLERNMEWYLSAGLVPMVVCAALGICALVLIVNALGSKLFFKVTPEELKATVCSRSFFATAFIIIWFAVYIFVLLEFLSYELATVLFLVVFIAAFAEKSWKKIGIGVAVSVVVTLAVSYCFGSLVGIPLP